MTNKQAYSLCEAVADIAFIASKENYETKDNREKFAQFIEWAKEFGLLHKNAEWGVNFLPEHIDSIELFAMFKIYQWGNL
jgi:hypothetical protein